MPTFVDTNVFVYAMDTRDAVKQRVAIRTLASLRPDDIVLSAQVMSEFYTVVTRRLASPLDSASARAALRMMAAWTVVPIDAALTERGASNSVEWQVSYWDGLIVAAAQAAGCDVMLTEDLTHDRILGGVRIENPFRVG